MQSENSFIIRADAREEDPSKSRHIVATSYNVQMMAPFNGNIIRVTGPLCGEFTGHRWIPLTKASDTELLCFLWSAPEQTIE